MCVIAPYSTNRHAREILNVPIDIEDKSSIYMSDSIALLVTLHGNAVSGLFEVSRSDVDFAALGGKCYRHDDSGFTVPDAGHPHASHVE